MADREGGHVEQCPWTSIYLRLARAVEPRALGHHHTIGVREKCDPAFTPEAALCRTRFLPNLRDRGTTKKIAKTATR